MLQKLVSRLTEESRRVRKKILEIYCSLGTFAYAGVEYILLCDFLPQTVKARSIGRKGRIISLCAVGECSRVRWCGQLYTSCVRLRCSPSPISQSVNYLAVHVALGKRNLSRRGKLFGGCGVSAFHSAIAAAAAFWVKN